MTTGKTTSPKSSEYTKASSTDPAAGNAEAPNPDAAVAKDADRARELVAKARATSAPPESSGD